jgi:hypothetical protein
MPHRRMTHGYEQPTPTPRHEHERNPLPPLSLTLMPTHLTACTPSLRRTAHSTSAPTTHPTTHPHLGTPRARGKRSRWHKEDARQATQRREAVASSTNDLVGKTASMTDDLTGADVFSIAGAAGDRDIPLFSPRLQTVGVAREGGWS